MTAFKHKIAILAGACAALVAATAYADRPAPGSATADRVIAPSGPSSVRGLAEEPGVDPFHAQLEYQVPIEMPGGFGGLAPSLALTYSGSLGNGPMGIGWTLAQPRIQRSTRLGVPKFDTTDQLEISGIASGRLVAIGNGEYRVEGRGQTVRVKSVPTGGFDVDDGSGVHYRLGTSSASRQESDSTHTLAWLVEQETNTQGETVSFTYSHDQNQIYLANVAWGPSSMYTATLDYERRTDQTKSYRDGFSVVTALRLATIRIGVSGTERRAYALHYDTTLSVARLSGVTSTGVGGVGAWPALTFTYAAPASPAITPIAGIGNWRLNSNGATLVDLDGDGAADLLQAAAGGHRYLISQNGVFGGMQPLAGNALPLDALQLQDVDGDARVELLQDTGSGWSVWKWTKAKWVAQPGLWPGSTGLALKQPNNTRFADLNGDGLADAIQWSNDGLQVHMATPTGLLPSHSVGRIGGVAIPTSIGRFQDVNGDGLADYIAIALDHLEIYVGHGDGTFDAMTRVAYPFVGTISDPQDIELADLDRDGLLDLIKIQTGTVLWFRGNPDLTFRAQSVTLPNPEPLSSTVVVAVADTNGNGSQDVVWSSASGMWRMDLAGTTTAGMLVEVTNGLGMDTTFDYQSSHALSAAARTAGNAWSSELPISIPVPVQRTTDLGAGETTRHITYSVRDGFWDATEQQFGGFLTTMVTTAGATAAQTSTVNTSYNKGAGANRELRGKPIVVQVFDGTGRRLSVTVNTWSTMVVSGLPDTPLLRAPTMTETVGQFEDVTPARKTDVKYTFDAFGRATHVQNLGRLDVDGDESITDTTYADDDLTWIRDRVCETKTSSVVGTVVSDVQTYFGDDVTQNALCVVGKGWQRETKAWLATENRWVSQASTRFNSHGNPIAATQGGVEHRFAYDPTGLFLIEERLTGPSGSDLVWQSTLDTVLGAVTSVTDQNGHTTHVTYDSLGRTASIATDAHLPHQIFEYDLTPPFPKTTTWTFDGELAAVTAKPAAWDASNKWRQTVAVHNGLGEVRYHAQRLSDTQWIVSDYHEVDAASRVVFAGRPVFSTALELSTRPASIVGDTLVYDPLGRLIEQDLPTGAKRTTSYVAFERTMQEANLAPVHSVLDGQGRAILTERSLPDGTHEIVQATYDPAGHLTQMTLSGGAVTRRFSYDTLGRVITTWDPDLGIRSLTWDDANRLLTETNATNQTVQYSYDSLGRLASRDTGSLYRYHYDSARPGATGPATNLAGRLAWIEEPLGGVDLSYDEPGRSTFTRRRIDGIASEATTTFSASGLALTRSYDDGFSYTYQYDPAGRPVAAGDLWTIVSQDASGQILHERTQNGVDTQYTRDILDLTSRVTIRDVDGTAIYDVSATRDPSTNITSESDLDNVGLDHSTSFTYDGFSRLTAASIGSGTQAYTFAYQYDALHNMTSRTASGPTAVQAMFGTYRYAEAGHAPRQLTSIANATGQVLHTFDYDAAGRQISEDALHMTFDASDRITSVTGLPRGSGTVTHAYGHNGDRIKTSEPDGTVEYFFGDGTSFRNGVREHDVTAGDRILARVAVSAVSQPDGIARTSQAVGLLVSLGWSALACAALILGLLTHPRRTRRRTVAAAMVGLVFSASCGSANVGRSHQTIMNVEHSTFMHAAFGSGPVVFTDSAGHLLEERRIEAFGTPIDAHIHTDSSEFTGPPDLTDRDLNPLNKRSDVATGWSDHGARWLASATGRWLSTDPPLSTPSAEHMLAPWDLNPYQYANQNPVAYWDPDGRSPRVAGVSAQDVNREVARQSEILYSSGVKAIAAHQAREALVNKALEGMQLMFVATGNQQAADALEHVNQARQGNWIPVALDVVGAAIGLRGGLLSKAAAPAVESLALDEGVSVVAEPGVNAVYRSLHSTGYVQYAGITNDLERRAAEHLASKGIEIEPLFENISRADARAVEQALIEYHGLSKNGGTLLNKINSISTKNPIYTDAVARGTALLKAAGYL